MRNIANKHQLRILIDLVKNPSKELLGTLTVKDAIKILKDKFKYSDKDIKDIQTKE